MPGFRHRGGQPRLSPWLKPVGSNGIRQAASLLPDGQIQLEHIHIFFPPGFRVDNRYHQFPGELRVVGCEIAPAPCGSQIRQKFQVRNFLLCQKGCLAMKPDQGYQGQGLGMQVPDGCQDDGQQYQGNQDWAIPSGNSSEGGRHNS